MSREFFIKKLETKLELKKKKESQIRTQISFGGIIIIILFDIKCCPKTLVYLLTWLLSEVKMLCRVREAGGSRPHSPHAEFLQGLNKKIHLDVTGLRRCGSVGQETETPKT